jgi:4-amino-4-deoxy-L-arabinose transferase-like glycosyltransferase
MAAKRIFAGIFAAIILVKFIIWLISPQQGFALAETLLKQQTLAMIIYLALLAVSGYFIFSSLNLIDIAVVMFFTSLLIALNLMPYAGELLKSQEEIISIGLGKAWLPWLIWLALAVAVLFKVIFPDRGQSR